jgi:group II intron reverse transcriptase/maturase
MKKTDLLLHEAASLLVRVGQPLPPLSGETRRTLGNTSSNEKCFLDDNSMEKQFVKIIHEKLKVHSLTGRITEELMLKSFKAVKKNKGSAGIDKMSIGMYESNLTENLLSLMKELKQGTYQPIPLRRVHIPKGDGKTRPLGIPSVKCRIAQEVVRRLINPTFENRFHENSFGFRPGRNCHQAVERVLQYAEQGHKFVVDVDIKGFFDNIPHNLIMDSIAARIADGNILNLIERFLKSGVMEEGEFKPTTKGTPQGGVISPLLANIALDHLDWYMAGKGFLFSRYADDFVVLCQTQPEAERALDEVRTYLEQMELQVSPEKTKICRFSEGFNFLGFTIQSGSVRMRTKSKEKFQDKIREITRRSNNLDKEVISKLNRVIRGTVNYFGTKFSTVGGELFRLDRWIRKRIRCMKYKRIWRTDNWRVRIKLTKKMGLLSCHDLYKARLQC